MHICFSSEETKPCPSTDESLMGGGLAEAEPSDTGHIGLVEVPVSRLALQPTFPTIQGRHVGEDQQPHQMAYISRRGEVHAALLMKLARSLCVWAR